MRVALIFFLLSVPAYAWTKADTQRQLVYTTLHVIDWGQTRDVVFHKYPERNILLGKHPSIQQVDIYFASTLAGHILVSYLLPPKYRKYWQSFWIGAELKTVVNNYSVGINVHF